MKKSVLSLASVVWFCVAFLIFVIVICKMAGPVKIGSIFEKKEYSATFKGTASSIITNYEEVEAGISFVCTYLDKSKQRAYSFTGVTLWNGDKDYMLSHRYNASLIHDNEIKPYYPNTVYDENGVEWSIRIDS